MTLSALIIDVTLWGSVAILGFMAWQRGRVVLVSSVREGSMDFINIVPRIALGVIGSGYIAAVIPPEVITGWLGPDSGWFGVLTAVIAGAATPGGPVVGFSIGAVALKVCSYAARPRSSSRVCRSRKCSATRRSYARERRAAAALRCILASMKRFPAVSRKRS